MRYFFVSILFFYFSITSNAATFKDELISPVTTKASTFFWSGTATTAVLILSEESFSDPATKEASEDKAMGRKAARFGNLYGQLIPNIVYTVSMWGHGKYFDNRISNTRASHMLKATLYAVSMTTILKYMIREPRPDNIHEKNSFPSGHTTTAFAFASTVAVHHEWYWGVLAIGGAAITAYSRMNDGRHFLHDVVAGMTIGTSYGLGVYYSNKEESVPYVFVPIVDREKVGLRIVSLF